MSHPVPHLVQAGYEVPGGFVMSANYGPADTQDLME
jgi:hypothetical protein